MAAVDMHAMAAVDMHAMAAVDTHVCYAGCCKCSRLSVFMLHIVLRIVTNCYSRMTHKA